MSWLLLIIFAGALAATMVGWAAVVASSLNHNMHASNGNGPGRERPSRIGKAECLFVAHKYKCEWLGVVSDGDVVNDADKMRSTGVAMRWQCGGCVHAFDREYRHFCERGPEAHSCAQKKDFTCSSCGRLYKDERSLARHQHESQCEELVAIDVVVARCTENKRRARAAGRKEDKRRSGEIGGKGGSKEDKRRAAEIGGKGGSKQDKRCAGEAGSKEDKQRAGHIARKEGSKEDKRRAGETESKEDKRGAGEARSKEDKRRAGEAGSKEDKWRGGGTGIKEDKQPAA